MTYADLCSDAQECAKKGREAYEKKDYSTSRNAFVNGCRLNGAWSCLQLGYSYWLWEGAEQTEDLAIKAFGKACTLGSNQGCEERAWLLRLRGGASDLDEALILYKTACESGRMQSCILGFQLGWAQGRGKEWEYLAPRIRNACLEGGMAACGVYGDALAGGTGVRRDLVGARRFYRRACSGDASWCERMWLLPGGNVGAWLNALAATACGVMLPLVRSSRTRMALACISAISLLILGFSTYLRTIGGALDLQSILPMAFAVGGVVVGFTFFTWRRRSEAPLMPSSAADEGKGDDKKNEEGSEDEDEGK
jgi:TPR repeat protein